MKIKALIEELNYDLDLGQDEILILGRDGRTYDIYLTYDNNNNVVLSPWLLPKKSKIRDLVKKWLS